MGKHLVIVETAQDKTFSCFMADEGKKLGFGLVSTGKTVREAMADFYAARDEMAAYYKEAGKPFPEMEFTFKLDVGAFFNYYPLSVTAFAKYIGMNASLLRQYASGAKVPQAKSLEKISNGIQLLLSNLSSDNLIEKPAVQYA